MRSQRLINLVTGRIKWRWNQPVYTRIVLTLVDPGRIRPSGRCLLVQPNSQCQQMGRSKDYKPMIQKMQWVNQLVKTVAMNPQNWISRRSLFPAILSAARTHSGRANRMVACPNTREQRRRAAKGPAGSSAAMNTLPNGAASRGFANR